MIKASVVSFLISLLLAVAVCSRSERVKDTLGNDLKTHQQYFIQPVKTDSNNGGGLVPAPPQIFPLCPLGIVQTPLQTQPGLPVNFSSPYSTTETTVDTQDYVTIEFQSEKIWICTEFSKFWKVDESSSAAEEPAILVGGTPQEPSNWFKIENAGEGAGANTYKFTTITGSPVGTKPGPWAGAPQLVLTDDTAKTLRVQFKKVDDATTATTSTRVEKLGLRMFPFY